MLWNNCLIVTSNSNLESGKRLPPMDHTKANMKHSSSSENGTTALPQSILKCDYYSVEFNHSRVVRDKAME